MLSPDVWCVLWLCQRPPHRLRSARLLPASRWSTVPPLLGWPQLQSQPKTLQPDSYSFPAGASQWAADLTRVCRSRSAGNASAHPGTTVGGANESAGGSNAGGDNNGRVCLALGWSHACAGRSATARRGAATGDLVWILMDDMSMAKRLPQLHSDSYNHWWACAQLWDAARKPAGADAREKRRAASPTLLPPAIAGL